jgi:hypothetical protein
LNCAPSAVGKSLLCPAQYVDARPKSGELGLHLLLPTINAILGRESRGWKECKQSDCENPYEYK